MNSQRSLLPFFTLEWLLVAAPFLITACPRIIKAFLVVQPCKSAQCDLSAFLFRLSLFQWWRNLLEFLVHGSRYHTLSFL